MTEKLPPQWALDKADIVRRYLEFSVSYRTNSIVSVMVATLLVEERERCAKICEEIMDGLSAHEAWHRLFKIAVARIRES